MKGKTSKQTQQWEKPMLTPIGKIQDFVKGAGKTGVLMDGDPFGSGKKGMG